MNTKKRLLIIIALTVLIGLIPLKTYSQNDFTDAEVDSIFVNLKRLKKCKKISLSLTKDLKYTDSISKIWEYKYINLSEISKNKDSQIILLQEANTIKYKKQKELKIIWRTKRNNAFLKGGVIGIIVTALIVLI